MTHPIDQNEKFKNTRIAADTKWKPSNEQRAVLLALQEEAKQETSVAVFARKFLPFTRSKYDQIMDVFDNTPDGKGLVLQSYFDRVSPSVAERLFEELQAIVDEIPLKRIQMGRIKEFNILFTSKIAALEQAIKEAKLKPGPERLIIVLGPTGAGKTITCNYLVKKNARFVEVRDQWRFSERGMVPLADICKAVGMRSWSPKAAVAQDQLVKYCGDLDIIVNFDEGEFFGAAALNLLKFLLNKTRLIPVIYVDPDQYDKWFQKYPNEAAQIARRSHAIIDNSIIELGDASLFFPDNQFANRNLALEILVREACKFGHFSLIKRVAEKLEGIVNATCEGKDSDLHNAISQAKRQMIRQKPTALVTK